MSCFFSLYGYLPAVPSLSGVSLVLKCMVCAVCTPALLALPLASLQLGSSGVAAKVLSAWQGWELLRGSSLSCPEQTVEQTIYCPMPVFPFSSRFLFRFVPFEFTVQWKSFAKAFVSEGRCLLWQKPCGHCSLQTLQLVSESATRGTVPPPLPRV